MVTLATIRVYPTNMLHRQISQITKMRTVKLKILLTPTVLDVVIVTDVDSVGLRGNLVSPVVKEVIISVFAILTNPRVNEGAGFVTLKSVTEICPLELRQRGGQTNKRLAI